MEFALLAAVKGRDRAVIAHHTSPDFAELTFFRRKNCFRFLVDCVRESLHGVFLSNYFVAASCLLAIKSASHLGQ